VDSPRNRVLLVLAIFFLGPVLLAGALGLLMLFLASLDIDGDTMKFWGVLFVFFTMLIGATVFLVAAVKLLQGWQHRRLSKGP
jgi:hypothetical protein